MILSIALGAYHAGVAFLYDPANREIAEALLVANVRAMTPVLAKRSLGVLLAEKNGFYRDVRLDPQGAATVLALRSKYSEARHASAIIQVVMPCVPGSETKQLASVTNRFLTSCDWQYGFSTEVFGSLPIRAEPHSCVASRIAPR